MSDTPIATLKLFIQRAFADRFFTFQEMQQLNKALDENPKLKTENKELNQEILRLKHVATGFLNEKQKLQELFDEADSRIERMGKTNLKLQHENTKLKADKEMLVSKVNYWKN